MGIKSHSLPVLGNPSRNFTTSRTIIKICAPTNLSEKKNQNRCLENVSMLFTIIHIKTKINYDILKFLNVSARFKHMLQSPVSSHLNAVIMIKNAVIKAYTVVCIVVYCIFGTDVSKIRGNNKLHLCTSLCLLGIFWENYIEM